MENEMNSLILYFIKTLDYGIFVRNNSVLEKNPESYLTKAAFCFDTCNAWIGIDSKFRSFDINVTLLGTIFSLKFRIIL